MYLFSYLYYRIWTDQEVCTVCSLGFREVRLIFPTVSDFEQTS